MKVRPSLHPVKDGEKWKLPPAPYNLSPTEKKTFCQFLKELKVSYGFSSNIPYCVNTKECKMSGLKSHDCHVILEHLLPLAIRGLLTPDVREALIELSMFFSILCAKEVDVKDLTQLEAQIPITHCKLEKVFPPSFFDITLHVAIHLVSEAKLGGPVQFRWMFPFEQYMYKLKSYVRNRAHPEAPIEEGYIADECMTLCSRYIDTLETKFNRLERNYEDDNNHGRELEVFCHPGRGLGGQNVPNISQSERDLAHIYILKNCDEVQPFLVEFSKFQVASNIGCSEGEWCRRFKDWFKIEVARLYEHDKSKRLKDLLALSHGPKLYVTSFSGYIVNGYRFHIENREKTLKTQNSGVVVAGNAGDGEEVVDFYGVVTEILELQYLGGNRVVLFRCKWWDVFDQTKGIKTDEYGFVSVNCNRLRQVFYANDNINKGWKVVIKCRPHNHYDKLNDDSSTNDHVDDTNDDSG